MTGAVLSRLGPTGSGYSIISGAKGVVRIGIHLPDQHRRTAMTTTELPTTTLGRIASDGALGPDPTDQAACLFRSPWSTAGESVERYFRFVNLMLLVTRQVAPSWTWAMGLPYGGTQDQPDTTRQTRTDPAKVQDVGRSDTTAELESLRRPGRPVTGILDGLIGHLLDLDITGSLGIR